MMFDGLEGWSLAGSWGELVSMESDRPVSMNSDQTWSLCWLMGGDKGWGPSFRLVV